MAVPGVLRPMGLMPGLAGPPLTYRLPPAKSWGAWLKDAARLVPSPVFAWWDEPGLYVFKAWLPGVLDEDLFVGVAPTSIRVSAVGRTSISDGDRLTYVRESRIRETVRLPSDVDVQGIRGTFHEGILSLYFPKGRRLALPPAPTVKKPSWRDCFRRFFLRK